MSFPNEIGIRIKACFGWKQIRRYTIGADPASGLTLVPFR